MKDLVEMVIKPEFRSFYSQINYIGFIWEEDETHIWIKGIKKEFNVKIYAYGFIDRIAKIHSDMVILEERLPEKNG